MKSQLSILQMALLACCAFIVTNTGVLAETVLIHDTFESYGLGTTPTKPGDGNTNNWVKGANLTNASVITGSSPNGEPANAQILALSRGTGSGYTSLNRKFTQQDSMTLNPGDYLELNFKLKIGSFANSDYLIILGDADASAFGGPVQLRLASSQVTAYRGTGSAGGAPIAQSAPLSLTANTWYQYSLNVDLLNQQYSLKLVNLTTSVETNIATGYFQQNITSLDNFLIRSTSTVSDNLALNWELNDVSLKVVPEPNVFMMSLFGIMVLFVIQRRRRTSKRV